MSVRDWDSGRVFTWFDFAWPWIGLGFAGVLAVLLFATALLRGDPALPRRHDLRWLSFLAVALYLVHNVEEYGVAANGVVHAFPDSLCELLGQPAFPDCGIPPAFFLFVNLPLVWVLGPVAAVLARRFPLAGMTVWGATGANSLVHVVPAILMREYDPGLLTAVVLFAPLTVLAFRAVLRSYRKPALPALLAVGGSVHAVLAGSLLLYLNGLIPEWLLLALQPVGMTASYLALVRAGRRLSR